ncbi:hypothetical protein GPECTOR_1g107 [Gonium pectorale]|uniref:Uncharacterized protein n=1 Tax=Gonium pectorale TaxID=33097 RepID=A0A150H1V2_GONPE|nr:hypothetical protein GPECTOR_1g107 [Gonium pectorale]|eukprot:KXZ56127.1 hypothetical protein GPECTOR_1g107 [Gonium pectorale]
MHRNAWCPPSALGGGNGGGGPGYGSPRGGGGGGSGAYGSGAGQDPELEDWARDVRGAKSGGGRSRGRRSTGGPAAPAAEAEESGAGRWYTNNAGVKVYVDGNGVEHTGRNAYKHYKKAGGSEVVNCGRGKGGRKGGRKFGRRSKGKSKAKAGTDVAAGGGVRKGGGKGNKAASGTSGVWLGKSAGGKGKGK